MITLDNIRPDGTGKYSDMLYRWCRKTLKSPPLSWMKDNATYQLPRAFLVGEYDSISVAKYSNYRDRNLTIWLGQRDQDSTGWLYGFWAAQIANPIYQIKNLQSFAIASNNIKDVTPWFWDHYLDMGTCFIVGDLKHDWIQINKNSRKCRHCLKHERRRVVSRTVHERWEEWGAVE